jgi:HD-GYP domain-containing protein (c-di-GMP phosphodiesterase class II)
MGSRIIAVCDAFDAMTSPRVYRRSISVEEALEELRSHAGSQFDETVVEAFCRQSSLHARTGAPAGSGPPSVPSS